MGVVGSEAAWAPFERCSGAASGRLEEVQSRTLLGRVKASGTVRICVWPDYYGVTHRNPNTQQLEGIDIDLAQSLATAMGAKLEVVKTYKRMQTAFPGTALPASVIVKAPDGISFQVESPVKFKVIGIDKQKVGEVAANIRKIRKPEPYKGKGVRYAGERVLRKAGKAGKK